MVKMKLHLLLEKYHLSQRELASETGIRYATINNYVNNSFKHIVRDHIDTLCSFFDCDLLDLIEYNPDKD